MNLDYIAGFIDGEGCLGVYLSNRGISSTKGINFKLQVVNTNRSVLDTIFVYLDSIGIRGHITIVKPRNPKWKEAYYYTISSKRDLISLLSQIVDKLVIKKEQARYLIEHCNLQPGSNKSFNISQFRSISH